MDINNGKNQNKCPFDSIKLILGMLALKMLKIYHKRTYSKLIYACNSARVYVGHCGCFVFCFRGFLRFFNVSLVNSEITIFKLTNFTFR